MTIHIFVGAGPANLHRALKIKKIDARATLVITDSVLDEIARQIKRDQARASIFHLETELIVQQLIADGIDATHFTTLSYAREFSLNKGFQYGDDHVFSVKPFTEIQIRDLQQLLLEALDKTPGPKPILLAVDLDSHSADSIEQSVAELLFSKAQQLVVDPAPLNLHIHAATASLKQPERRGVKVYALKNKYHILSAAKESGVAAATPAHGITTFFIRDPQSCGQYVSCRELESDQRSLDTTDWQSALRSYGWHLIRPPRIRIFYANDVLYVGAEIPAKINALSDNEYQTAVTNYTRAIASLVFPHTNISELPVNPHLHPRTHRERGLSEQVLSTAQFYNIPWGNSTRAATVQVYNHGHSRYLAHYQTGSGFVTAFLQNEIYIAIYQQKTLASLLEWAIAHHHVENTLSIEKISQSYARIISQQQEIATEERILQAFKTDLFMAISRDIFDQNQAVMARYFEAIHAQTVLAIEQHFPEILEDFNQFLGTNLTQEDFAKLDKRIVVLRMLQLNHIGFLCTLLPRLLNLDLTAVDNDELMHIRHLYLIDFKKHLPPCDQLNQLLGECDLIIKKENFIKKIKAISTEQFKEFLSIFNTVHQLMINVDRFPNHFIAFMELLNRNGKNTYYIRRVFVWLFETNLVEITDSTLLALRDRITQNYLEYVDKITFSDMVEQLMSNIPDAETTPLWRHLFQLAIQLYQNSVQATAARLNLPLLANQADQRHLRKKLCHIILEKMGQLMLEPSPPHELLPYIQHLIQIESGQLPFAIQQLMNEFADKTVNQRMSFLFFRERHSQTINHFLDELQMLLQQNLPIEQFRLGIIQALVHFHDELIQDKDQKPLDVLEEVLTAAFFAHQPGEALIHL